MNKHIGNINASSKSGLAAINNRKSWLVIALSVTLGLAGCQPKSEEGATDSDVAVSQQEQPKVVMSESAKAQIARFEEEYVNRKLNLQQSQLAEYEALQAADSPEENKALFAAAEGADNAIPEKKTVGQKLIDQKKNTQNVEAAKSSQAQDSVGSELTDAAVTSDDGVSTTGSDVALPSETSSHESTGTGQLFGFH